MILASGTGPRGRRNLQHEPIARVVPRHESLRMTPGGSALLRAPRDGRIAIKLVVPDDVVEIPVVDFPERCPKRISGRFSVAPCALLQARVLVTREGELLSEARIVDDGSAESAHARDSATATGKRCSVELEDEPPRYRLSRCEQRDRRVRSLRARHCDENRNNQCA